MATGKRVFIVGPGFIGWNVIDLLVKEKYVVTGLVRREQHADGIRGSGATALMGDLNDKALIAEQASKNDIVIHTATADHLPSAEAILDGVKKRAEQGLMTIYIHTSGTSVLDDGSKGAFKSNKIYRDDTREEIDTVPDDAPHREIDLAITAVHKELASKAKIAIMIPPLIYGFNKYHNRLTIQIPTLTRFALKHGFSGVIGEGLSVESNIHVMDLARGYVVLLHHLESSSPDSPDLRNPYYFCECTGDDEPSWLDVATVIGQALFEKGRVADPTPRVVPEDLYKDLFSDFTDGVIALNSRSRANRLRALGWSSIEKDWKTSFVEDELPEILVEDLGTFSGYAGIVPVIKK